MAEIDIVPELLAHIQQDFNQAYKNDTKIQQLANKISSGKADYADAQEFAQRTGELMAAALQKNITADKLPNGQMYYNIADRILGTMLKTDYGIVAKKAAEVQQHLNENAGLGLKAQTADYDEENAKSIIDKVSASEDFNKVSYMLKAPVETFSMKVVDDTIKKNADFHYKAGLKPRIVRSAETKCCDWCASLDGTYEYPGVPKEVFARHNNCRCTVNYDPRDGKVQNVWNKKEWKDAEEYDKIEMRKNIQPEDDRDKESKAQRIINAKKDAITLTPQERIFRASRRLSVTASDEETKTERVYLGKIGHDEIAKKIDQYKEEFRTLKTENALVIDKDGNMVRFISNNAKTVIITDVDLDGAYVLHNHPAVNGIVSFGADDFNFYRSYPNAHYILCNEEYDYYLEVKKDISFLSYTKVTHMNDRSPFDDSIYEEDYQHIVMEEFSRKGYVEYERRKKSKD